MTGFDIDWLDLREPADRRARDARLLQSAVDLIAGSDHPHVLDIGCGTGSTYRAFRGRLRDDVRWSLFDHDEALLEEAQRRVGGEKITFIRGDLNVLAALPLDGMTIVTASALFDLCSGGFIERFARRLRQTGAGLYATLNYDGRMIWSVSHPLDEVVTKAFNAHQRTDKGFGISAGPDAWKMVAACLQAQGYKVEVGSSTWLMEAEEAPLQRLFLRGVANAVAEQGAVAGAALEEWHAFRSAAVGEAGSSCRVGHQDVLAFL